MKKNTEISERINQLIVSVGVSKNEFGKKLGYERSQIIYDMIKGKAKPSFDFFEKLVNSEYSEFVNISNLISGRGLFLIKPNVKKMPPSQRVAKRVAKGWQNQMLEKRHPLRGIPLIPIDAMAGFGGGDLQVMEYDTSLYNVPEFTELNAEFMIRVKGSSMYPKYNSGDLVACKKLSESGVFFQWNKVYVLATDQGALIKRVKKGKKENYITLVSDNPKYDPFELHTSQVYSIALVIGVIRLE